MTNTKKRKIIVSSVCAIVVIAALASLFVWKSTFDEERVIGKTQNEIEQRYGEADFCKDNYIEYWTKQKLGYYSKLLSYSRLQNHIGRSLQSRGLLPSR